MAGIYIHVPFCKKRCFYCDFFSDTAKEQIPAYVDALLQEIDLRKDFLPEKEIQTIYFGGGTPSLLDKKNFERIFEKLIASYHIATDAEITFEANPDDLTAEYFNQLSSLPFNRISIGTQSFNDTDLKQINRRHTSQQAIDAITLAKKYGFKNISIDLIYGLPGQTLEAWEEQLDIALRNDVQHVSAYGLTYEEGTALWQLRKAGKLSIVDDEVMNEMYLMLLNKTQNNGFEAYEISNFAKPGFRSKHNSSYWKQIPYIGLGPGAHSYNGEVRQWNVASIASYVKGLSEGKLIAEQERLSLHDQYNDFIMLSLRTSEGIDLQKLEEKFGTELSAYCLENIKTFIETEKADYTNRSIRLSTAGILISDMIMAELMWV